MKLTLPLLLAICCVALGWIGGWHFNPYETTRERLIESWRLIEPGMPVDEVDSILGLPMYDFSAGSDRPGWVAEVLSEEVMKGHSIRAYCIDGFGPQFLLVAFDASDKVAFVGSTHT
ncbi:hypothetical protein [Sulfuriroseicoccus oceanibius]|uniref:Uncharacterized protein n=1 Tax=Sulfuriroseicoccus oceanibius TaxID=2707525 RepID=A0A6B3LFW7_9BACT|nr:hypothetical protein [Sulfuriroseicoccus oceanibius]QQL44422.1 hypothetical protein G3M56_011070 [Sulfuriroseicoccus oceanibius]